MVSFKTDMQIIELDSFEAAFPVRPEGEEEVKRRFMTLFAQAQTPVHLGGTSFVHRVFSYTGEPFALKRLALDDGANAQSKAETALEKELVDAFYEEYRNQLLVSNLRGFPKLYGYGTIRREPVIIMEWIEGMSLRELMGAFDETTWIRSGKNVAAMGLAVLDVLDNASRLDATFVHRDLTPANIMVRNASLDAADAGEIVEWDVCLIDFGNSTATATLDPAFTATSQRRRMGTPEYAPPEMLAEDLPEIDELRAARAIDVFALCGILYELYSGRTPWRIAEHPDLSPYEAKTERDPHPLELKAEDDGALADAIMAGLHVEQVKRPSATHFATMLRDCFSL